MVCTALNDTIWCFSLYDQPVLEPMRPPASLPLPPMVESPPHLDGDQSLCTLGDVPGDSDVGPRDLLDTVDLGSTATDHTTHQ